MSASPTPEPGQALAPARLPLDAVVGHHLNPYASGVARFNQVLAEHLGVPMIGLDDPLLRDSRSPLYSFKVSELPEALAATLGERLAAAGGEHPVACFLHEMCGLALEQRLIEQSAVVYAGNDEILHSLEGTGANVVRAWAPGLISDHRPFKPAALTVFS